MGRAYYVIPDGNGWAVKLERGRVVSPNHRKQSAAIDEAKRLARQPGTAASSVVINGRDGATRRHIKNP